MTEEEQRAVSWLVGERTCRSVSLWQEGYIPNVTAEASKLAKACYADGFVAAAVRAYRRVFNGGAYREEENDN